MTMPAPVLAPAMRRARKDPIARLIAAAAGAGVRFRTSGAALVVDGAEQLHPVDRGLLRTYVADIRTRLEPPPADADLLDDLDVEQVEVITDAARAREVLASLSGGGPYGLDLETAPIASGNGASPWLVITKSGTRAKVQPRSKDKAGLDPMRARPRLVQVFDPATGTAYLFDLATVPVDALRGLEQLKLVAHNASFEVLMLQACGIRLRHIACTLLLAQLACGAERGGLRLAEVAETFLEMSVPKSEQLSDWSATRLSSSQIGYAAADAALPARLVQPIWRSLDAGARQAYSLSVATIPAVASMRLAGVPFDTATHERTIAEWEEDYSGAYARFTEITGEPVPPAGAQTSSWLEARLPEDMLQRWPRTNTGRLRTQAADMDRAAVIPAIRPLLDVGHADRRLRNFGRKLLDMVGPDGRLRFDLRPAATRTGRCTCTSPNLQQLPQDARRAVIAPDGRIFIDADYQQLELRTAAELSGDEAMHDVFRRGEDLHSLNACRFAGVGMEHLTKEQRQAAKAISFGSLFGASPQGIVAIAWNMFRVEITESEAQQYLEQFYSRYPRLRLWQIENADQARVTQVIRSVCGRPLRAAWDPKGYLRWTVTCNYPVQSSAADVMLIAMAKVHAALEQFGTEAGLILQIHDELLVETNEIIADEVSEVVEREMAAAWTEVFPDAPATSVVDVDVRQCWAKGK